MQSVWAAALLLRRLRVEWGAVLLIMVLVGSTSFLFAAAPRVFERAAEAALREELLAAPATRRDVTARAVASIPPGRDGGVSGPRALGNRLAADLPPSVAALISDRMLRVTTLRLWVPEPPSYETHLSLRYQDGVESETRLVAGRWPVDRGTPLELPEYNDVGEPQPPGEPVVVEVAFSSSQAAEIGVELGDRLGVVSDGSDPLVRASFVRIAPAVVEVVGLFDPIDPGADYWADDAGLLVADQAGSDDNPIAYATAYVAAEQYPSLAAVEQPFHIDWLFRVDPERIDTTTVAQLRHDLPRLDRVAGTAAVDSLRAVDLRSGLLPILDRYAAQRTLAESALSIAVLGPFALATTALLMAAILLARRRAAALALARGRGAGGSLVLAAQLWEAILVAGPAALAGLALAIVAVPARASAVSVLLALLVGGTATLLLVAASWRAARQPLGRTERDDAAIVRVPMRRLVIEATIVGLAAAATVLLTQRGLSVRSEDGVVRADPLLASVPVLSGLAAGIVAMRLYPMPIRGVGWLAARRRDLVPVLGLRTVGRRSGSANLPVLALLLTAAFGAFSSVIATSLDRGEVVASYADVGADYRVERIGSQAFTFLDPADVPGIEAVAGGYIENATFARTERQRASIHVEAIDVAAHQAVLGGTPADPAWPHTMLAPPAGSAVGTPDDPIPAILSSRLPALTASTRPGDTFRMTLVGTQMTFRVVEQRATFAGIDDRLPFVVVPFEWVRAATERGRLPILRYWLRGSAQAAQPLATAIAGAIGSARIVSRHDLYAELRNTPLGALVVVGYGLAVVVAGLYLTLTIVGALILSAARRTRDTAYLRVLGVSSPQSLALTALEHGPPVLLALLPGIALGIGVAILCLPALGLTAFTGSSVAIPPTVDAAALATLVVALCGVVAVAVAGGTWLAGRARLVNALRVGDD